MNTKEKLKHISNIELLNEVKDRLKNKIITRKDLLNLAGINWCLECRSGPIDLARLSFGRIESNGYCENCNDDQVRIVNYE